MTTVALSNPARLGSRAKPSKVARAGPMIAWALLAAVAFHLSYGSSFLAILAVVYLFALVQLSGADTARKAFYAGLAVGLLIAVGRLDFFWKLFGPAAVALWLVYAFWIGLFVLLAREARQKLPKPAVLLALPTLWCGLEYFRSELYYLRFSWLTPGLAFGTRPENAPVGLLGVYGVGFLLMLGAGAAALRWGSSRVRAGLYLALAVCTTLACGRLEGAWRTRRSAEPGNRSLSVAGVQLEFPTESEAVSWLSQLSRRYPTADLLVLSEYTFNGPVPDSIKQWCRQHRRYLLVGAKDPISTGRFYDSAFVISPAGEVVFRQAKSVPIQFFNDGLPAPRQAVWESPWGKLGVCICYDLSYTRVTDGLVRLGAQGLIVPTMDLAEWGRREHELHARIGPIRAAEYGLPVLRLASSGVSQAINGQGRVIAAAPCPGQGAMLAATLSLGREGRRPADRWLAPAATGVSALALATLLTQKIVRSRQSRGSRC